MCKSSDLDKEREQTMKNKMQMWKKGCRDGIPIGLGYLAVSFTFGIVAKKAGLSPFQSVLMSATNLTSAGQFAALDIIVASAPYLEMAITQLIINLRYSLMSGALSQKLDPKTPFFHRFFMAFAITDEIFGASILASDKLDPFYSYGLLTASWPGWTFGTLLGAMMGAVLPARLLSAMSIALYGMFIASVIPPAKQNKFLMLLVVVSMLMSGLFSWIPVLNQISSGFKIIILTIVLAGAAAFFYPIKEDGHAE